MSNSAEPSPRSAASGFEQHSLAQLRRLARLSLAEKLDWLEGAQRLAAQLQRPAEVSHPSAETTNEP